MCHLIEPDLGRISGGLHYNRRVVDAADGAISRHRIPGSWPAPTRAEHQALMELVGQLNGPVLIDGLIGCNLQVPLDAPVPVVQLVHALVDTPATQSREARNIRAADAVVVTSHYAATQMHARYGIHPTVAQPGVDVRPLATGSHGGQFLCVGAIEPNKHQLFLVRTLHRLHAQDVKGWQLTCAGPVTDANYARQLEQAAAALPDGAVTITGALDETALAKAYDRADLVLLASKRETYGMVVAEAAAAGIPALVTAGTGAEEALNTGQALPLNEVQWADSLDRWLNDADYRAAMKRDARAARQQLTYGWDHSVAIILDVLASVLNGREQPG